MNTPDGAAARADGYEIRAAATAQNVPLISTISALDALVAAIDTVQRPFQVCSLQEYDRRRRQRAAARAAAPAL